MLQGHPGSVYDSQYSVSGNIPAGYYRICYGHVPGKLRQWLAAV